MRLWGIHLRAISQWVFKLLFCIISLKIVHLTHGGWDKIAAIMQMTFLNALSWMKMYEFQLKIHCNLFLRFELTISQDWFRWPGDKPLSEPMLVSLMTHIFVTRPQWVKVAATSPRVQWVNICSIYTPEGLKSEYARRVVDDWGCMICDQDCIYYVIKNDATIYQCIFLSLSWDKLLYLPSAPSHRKINHLTHWGLVTPFSDIDLGQHWLR